MKIIHMFLVIGLLCVSTITKGQYHAVYVPEKQLSNIKFDGNIKDWDWVPKEYYLSRESLYDLSYNLSQNKGMQKDSWNCRFFVAWDDIRNWIYIVGVIHDDFWNVDSLLKRSPSLDDNIKLAVSTYLGKGNNYRQDPTKVIMGYLIFPVIDKNCEFGIDNTKGRPTWYIDKSAHADWGLKMNKKNDHVDVTFELGLSLWDEWTDFGSALSKRSNLKENQTIKLGIVFNDIDQNNKTSAKWSTLCKIYWWRNFEDLSEFTLDKVYIPENISWDGIYQILNP